MEIFKDFLRIEDKRNPLCEILISLSLLSTILVLIFGNINIFLKINQNNFIMFMFFCYLINLIFFNFYLYKKQKFIKKIFKTIILISIFYVVILFFDFISIHFYNFLENKLLLLKSKMPIFLVNTIFIIIFSFIILFLFLFKLMLIDILVQRKFKQDILIFLKGFISGIGDIIPGISGGTMLFILDIYQRTINSISNVTLKNLLKTAKYILTFKKKKLYNILKKLDIFFVLKLNLSIVLAIYILSKLIHFLLVHYDYFIKSFFLGLILISIIHIEKHLDKKNNYINLYSSIGFFIMISLLFLGEFNFNPTPLSMLIAGIVSISIMFIPGVSGSYILLIFGVYQYFVLYMGNIGKYFLELLPFYLGVILGFFIFPKIIKKILEKNYINSMNLIFGIIIGSLFLLGKEIFKDLKNKIDSNLLTTSNLYTEILLCIFFVIIGILVIYLIENFKNRK